MDLSVGIKMTTLSYKGKLPKKVYCASLVGSVDIRTFALIVSVHPYCASKFTCHVMHERAR